MWTTPMKTYFQPRPRAGFTLIELLVKGSVLDIDM